MLPNIRRPSARNYSWSKVDAVIIRYAFLVVQLLRLLTRLLKLQHSID